MGLVIPALEGHQKLVCSAALALVKWALVPQIQSWDCMAFAGLSVVVRACFEYIAGAIA